MAANNKQIGATIVLRAGNFFANAKKASASLKGLKAKFNSGTSASGKFSSGISAAGNSLSSLAKKAVGAATAYVGFRQTKDFLTDCVTGVMELERANTRLETLMMNVSGTTKAQVKDLIDYGDALELCTTIEGDATMAGASQLATFQLSADTIKTLLPAFQDLAVAQYGVNVSQEQMINSGNLIGKVMNGSVGALTKAGVSFTAEQEKILKTGTESEKAAALVEVLGKNFGGLAQQMAQTDEGRIRQLKNAWGSVKDEVGFAVLPAVSGLVQYLSSNIPNIREKVTSAIEKIKPIAADLWEKTKSGAKTVGNMISWAAANWDKLAPIIAGAAGAVLSFKGIMAGIGIAEKIQKAIPKFKKLISIGKILPALFANPITWIVVGIGAAVAGLVLLYRKSEKFRNFVNKTFSSIASFAKNTWSGIVTALKPLASAIANTFQQAWELIKVVWGYVKPYFEIIWEGIKIVFSVVKPVIGGFFGAAWALVKAHWGLAIGYFTAIWNTIAGIFSVVKSVLSGDWQGAWDAIRGIVGGWVSFFKGIWESIKQVFSSVGSWFSGVFTAAGNAIKKIFNGILGLINKKISGTADLLNKLIDGVNKITGAVGIPAIPHVTAPQIPMLANGGFIRHPGSVLVGERGPEVLRLPRGASVAPLPAGAGGGTYYNTFHVTVNADDDRAAERFVKKVKQILDNM